VGDAAASARRREGVQEILANEATDEAEALTKINRQANERGLGFGTVEARERRNRWKGK
jgi:hypothetical protein